MSTCFPDMGQVEGNWNLCASVVCFCYSSAKQHDCGKTCADRLVHACSGLGSLPNQYSDRCSSLPWCFKGQIVTHYVTSHPVYDFIVSVTLLSKTTQHGETFQHLLQIKNDIDCEHAVNDFHPISRELRRCCPFWWYGACCSLMILGQGLFFYSFSSPTSTRQPLQPMGDNLTYFILSSHRPYKGLHRQKAFTSHLLLFVAVFSITQFCFNHQWIS